MCQVFLNRIAAHPILSTSPELQLFLEATEDTWAVEMARGQSAAAITAAAGAGGSKTVLENTVGFFKGLGAAATSIVGGSGRAGDAAEDPEYIKVCTGYLNFSSNVYMCANANLIGVRCTCYTPAIIVVVDC